MKYSIHSIFIPNKQGLRLDTEIYRPEISGRLPVVMLLHGFTGYKEDPAMVDIAQRLADSGIVSIRFTASGFGGSDGTLEKDYRFSNHRTDVDVEYEHICHLPYVDTDRVGVYGHSMGGKLAILFTSYHQDVRTICIASTPVSFKGTMYEKLKDDWETKGYFEKISGRDGKTIRVPFEVFRDSERPEFDVLCAAKKIINPHALIIAGSEDTEVPWKETRRIHDALGCPKEWLLLEGVSHKYGKKSEMMPLVSEPVVQFFVRHI